MKDHIMEAIVKAQAKQVQTKIRHLHDCVAVWLESMPVHEVFKSRKIWKGAIEVFNLIRHPKAKRYYGWFCDGPEEFITILELPPVHDDRTAAKIGVAFQIKKARRQ